MKKIAVALLFFPAFLLLPMSLAECSQNAAQWHGWLAMAVMDDSAEEGEVLAALDGAGIDGAVSRSRSLPCGNGFDGLKFFLDKFSPVETPDFSAYFRDEDGVASIYYIPDGDGAERLAAKAMAEIGASFSVGGERSGGFPVLRLPFPTAKSDDDGVFPPKEALLDCRRRQSEFFFGRPGGAKYCEYEADVDGKIAEMRDAASLPFGDVEDGGIFAVLSCQDCDGFGYVQAARTALKFRFDKCRFLFFLLLVACDSAAVALSCGCRRFAGLRGGD